MFFMGRHELVGQSSNRNHHKLSLENDSLRRFPAEQQHPRHCLGNVACHAGSLRQKTWLSSEKSVSLNRIDSDFDFFRG